MSRSAPNEICKNCRHFDPCYVEAKHKPNNWEGHMVSGKCRAGIPSLQGMWPIVQITDWCGSFREAPKSVLDREKS